MRLWSYQLIPVLPNKMLVAEWRECIAIKRQWEKGTLKHSLVDYVKDYPRSMFKYYVSLVAGEMNKRNIKYNKKYLDEISDFCNINDGNSMLNYSEHNNRYLKQCLYNLEEKFDRGIINEEEWNIIYEKYQDLL